MRLAGMWTPIMSNRSRDEENAIVGSRTKPPEAKPSHADELDQTTQTGGKVICAKAWARSIVILEVDTKGVWGVANPGLLAPKPGTAVA